MKTRQQEQEQINVARELIDSISDDLPVDRQIQEEQAVEDLIRELDSREAFQVAMDALRERAKKRHPGFQNIDRLTRERETAKFGSRLIEAGPRDLPLAGEQILRGRNVAAVVRAGQYQDVYTDILEPLQALRGLKLLEREEFPKPGRGGHSLVHLDVKYDRRTKKEEFPYSLSVSKVNKGQVLFIAGLASTFVYNWSRQRMKTQVQYSISSNRISGLWDNATELTSPRGVGYKEWTETGKGFRGNFVATTLGPGDIVIWPQGGAESRLPAWHGFIQIGHPQHPSFEARNSTSYHLGV